MRTAFKYLEMLKKKYIYFKYTKYNLKIIKCAYVCVYK